MSDVIKQIATSRAIWGGIVLCIQAVFGTELASAVTNVFTALNEGVVGGVVVSVGAALVAVGRIWGKPILAKV